MVCMHGARQVSATEDVAELPFLTCIRTLSMTFGRPATIPNHYMRLELPVNQNLEKLSMMGTSTGSLSTLDPPDTVCLFIATM